jgi:hypothetical protein
MNTTDEKESKPAKVDIMEVIGQLRKKHPKASKAKLVEMLLKLARDDDDLIHAMMETVVHELLLEQQREGRLPPGTLTQ